MGACSALREEFQLNKFGFTGVKADRFCNFQVCFLFCFTYEKKIESVMVHLVIFLDAITQMPNFLYQYEVSRFGLVVRH